MSRQMDDAEKILREAVGERLRTRFPLAPLTSFRIGGPADLFLEPDSMEDLGAVALAHRETGVAVGIVGKGSNILVSDGGFRGLVIRMGRGLRWSARDGDMVSAGAAMPLGALSGVAWRHSLSGLEFGVAIPASFGGAVRMNAGAHGGSIAEIAESVECFSLDSGESKRIPASEAGFAYRGSALPGLVVSATLRLRPGSRDEIRREMDEVREWRRANQPLAEPNCGSVFRNPPGDHAARMIEEAGMKGLTVGGASVSQKHANFIIAATGTTAADVIKLIELVQEAVEDMFGVRLDREVHLIGDFGIVTR